MEGYEVKTLESVLSKGHLFVTTTGNKDIITLEDFERNERSSYCL